MKKSTSLSLLLLCVATAFGIEVPKLRGHINDYANMLNSQDQQFLEKKLKSYEDSTSSQVIILTIPSLEGETIEGFSMQVAESWKVGKKGKDNGILLTVSKEDRRIRIETGYGFEATLPDATCKYIIDNIMEPEFKEKNYYKGFDKGVDAMIAAAAGEFKADGETLDGRKILFFVVAFIICVIGAVACSANLALGAGIGGFGSALAGFFILLNPTSWILVIIAVIGALASLFLYAGVGEEGDGFLIAALDSSGGGGGWSGGGGGFGGGGASGGW